MHLKQGRLNHCGPLQCWGCHRGDQHASPAMMACPLLAMDVSSNRMHKCFTHSYSAAVAAAAPACATVPPLQVGVSSCSGRCSLCCPQQPHRLHRAVHRPPAVQLGNQQRTWGPGQGLPQHISGRMGCICCAGAAGQQCCCCCAGDGARGVVHVPWQRGAAELWLQQHLP
jgi:hypothetical protein